MQYKLLSNGINIPTLGYGTLHISPAVTEKCVLGALHVGYRLIDTAAVYGNEKEIGQAIKKSKTLEKNFLSLQKYGFKMLVTKIH